MFINTASFSHGEMNAGGVVPAVVATNSRPHPVCGDAARAKPVIYYKTIPASCLEGQDGLQLVGFSRFPRGELGNQTLGILRPVWGIMSHDNDKICDPMPKSDSQMEQIMS